MSFPYYAKMIATPLLSVKRQKINVVSQTVDVPTIFQNIFGVS